MEFMIKNKIVSFWKIFFGFLVFSIVFFITRLQNLTSIPVFGDEAIYIRWSQIIKSVETLRFIPVTDGKQPFFMWIVAGVLKFFNDPLLSGRLVSVLSGFGILLMIFLVSCLIPNFFSKEKKPLIFISESIKNNFRVGFISILIYIFLPFSFFFDRMALPDNLLSFFGILSLFFSLLLAKFKRLDLSLILGMVLGLAWLTKSPAIYFIVLSFITFIFLNISNPQSIIDNLRSIFLPIISFIISFIIYNILRLGPQFQMIALRNKDYIWPISEIFKHPFDPFKPHMGDVFTIYLNYISLPILLIALSALIIIFVKKQINFKVLTLVLIITFWWILPLLANAAIAKVFTARYILFTLPPLIILFGLAIDYLINLNKKILFILPFLFILNIILIFNISVKPFNVKLSSTEIGYLRDWTSGWGIKETSNYLKSRAKVANVIVGTEGYFGTLPDGLEIYTQNTKQLTVFGIGLGFNKIPEKLLDAKNHGDEVYILINQSRVNLLKEEMNKTTTVLSYPKPGNDKLLLLKI